MTKKMSDWWKRDHHKSTFLKALLLGLLPLLVCIARCASDGHGIGDTYLPAGEWNDELFYFKQVESILKFGFPQGYYGFNESHALKLSFAAWSPVLVYPWLIWGLIFGWNLLSPIYCNIVIFMLTCFAFVWLVKPTWKQLGITGLLFALFSPFSRFMLSGMPEIICFSHVILFYGVAVSYLRKEKGSKLALLFVMAAVMTLMRPYLLLFLLLPAFLWIRKRGWLGAFGSLAVIGVTLAAYAGIKHYFGAEYFAPLFFTDWVEAFFTKGIFGGIRYTLGKLYYMGKDFILYLYLGVLLGRAAGAYFWGFLVIMLVLFGACVTDFGTWRKFRRREQEAGEDIELSEKSRTLRKEAGDRLIVQAHLLLSFVAMFFALLLMYKLTEGSKHLITFMAAGIFLIGLMETRFFKKAILVGVTFAFFYMHMAIDPYDYQVPFAAQELQAQMEDFQKACDASLQLVTDKEVPNFDNVVIWTLTDTKGPEDMAYVKWQYLYYIPNGFGISCCEETFVTENLSSLQSRYLLAAADGALDKDCAAAGYKLLYKNNSVVLYALR